ncbi:MAG: S-methyl-5-thioribose-1-phosphate isomerase [Zetaproteobacteria bacterium CG_4_9_14_3_um_filter_49_83]|nr:MAG: S-methyl-5-thioribose-1-phosphate isomerase [Zetaproteobacteria bacterium CG1_02_49_23]PIQ29898.1 MAG: S-methyl-5-thioribose-1-phosphate isomerase [Zetaproteobacteria bacterium CG17_big_fil_post_rev_8_21_14_2_50_50_13]PIV31027.1 MAG: S-methyl-5-thioribose-1-phosphate isomerase [Zetaproteobacteria bacterium CG02_land_8_20_14_3_00_50_9]PIY55210.1 MAG: S-methyl-5-thioribose-1-phosphate isomerase [Zetaproteobacteria bacterium CG_4_10_14_0_8_um_filter_49_80]PJA36226.1 MAG: S-methyl-5-thiorib
MNVNGIHYQAVFWKNSPLAEGEVCWIDQCALPTLFRIKSSRDPEVVAQAIESMEVRGAPSIGAFAALGLALAAQQDWDRVESYWLARFRRTRPTAVNLFHACDAMQQAYQKAKHKRDMVDAAENYCAAEVARNKQIGGYLAEVLAVGERRILTHCNAGWLAAVDWGTALSGIYHLQQAGETPFVWVDETRPRLQGARLTAWELHQQGIACQIQADSAAAWMIASGKVDAIVVGADRIARNGDVANKIGTYGLSLAAKAHGIPMYVAAPESTFDTACPTGKDIPIEQRADDEVLIAAGPDEQGIVQHIHISASGVGANNPAFDVTPYANLTGIISERGLWQP